MSIKFDLKTYLLNKYIYKWKTQAMSMNIEINM